MMPRFCWELLKIIIKPKNLHVLSVTVLIMLTIGLPLIAETWRVSKSLRFITMGNRKLFLCGGNVTRRFTISLQEARMDWWYRFSEDLLPICFLWFIATKLMESLLTSEDYSNYEYKSKTNFMILEALPIRIFSKNKNTPGYMQKPNRTLLSFCLKFIIFMILIITISIDKP